MKDLKSFINKRKSCRDYIMLSLDENILEDIKQHIKTIKPLYENIKTEVKFDTLKNLKGRFMIKSPHYIVFYSENKPEYLVNAGFILEQLGLYLTSIGLGCCFLGLTKPKEQKDKELQFIITMAFGNSKDSPYRAANEFKRKNMETITDFNDKVLESVRLAPSAMNGQPWFFEKVDAGYNVYCTQHGVIKAALLGDLNKIDIGIALSHLYVCHDNFKFVYNKEVLNKSGYKYMGTVSI